MNAWWITLSSLAGAWSSVCSKAHVAYARIPSFVVTLGGLLFLRNAACRLNDGAIAPLSATFQNLGGGQNGVLQEPLPGWAAAVVVTLYIVFNLVRRYQRKKALGVPSVDGIRHCLGGCLVRLRIRSHRSHEQLQTAGTAGR